MHEGHTIIVRLTLIYHEFGFMAWVTGGNATHYGSNHTNHKKELLGVFLVINGMI